MPHLTGPQVITELRKQLQNYSGRHLYVALGTYEQLDTFCNHDLAPALRMDGRAFPKPLNFNRTLLDRIEDESLRRMVRDESRRPQAVESQLNQAFEQLLRDCFAAESFLILKQSELLFAYNLDLSKLRTYAANQNHLLLLLPGRLVSNQIILFHEADGRFQQQFPGQLVTENNVWEIKA
jgi:hypothetical protein